VLVLYSKGQLRSQGRTVPMHHVHHLKRAKLESRVIVQKGALVVLSSLLALMALEAALRAREALAHNSSDQERLYIESATLRPHRVSEDPVLRYELRPRVEVERDGTIYRINALGFRAVHANDSPATAKAGARRILLLGDSIAFGLGVSYEKSFAHLMEKGLGARGLPTAVLNLAVLGYKTSQEIRVVERAGWELNPDGVILAFCLNDFDDFSTELSLLYPSGSSGVTASHRLPPRRLMGVELPEPVPFLDESLLFRKLSGRLLRPDYYLWIGTEPARRREVASAIGRLGRMLAERTIPGLLVIFPLLVPLEDYPYESIHCFVTDQALAAGLGVVDLRPAFASEPVTDLHIRPGDVLHLSERAHAITARVLVDCAADPGLRCR